MSFDYPEVQLALSHHDRNSTGGWTSCKPLVFVLDELEDPGATTKKEEGKLKKKKVTITAKNFGAWVPVPKLKAAENLLLAWRVRLLALID